MANGDFAFLPGLHQNKMNTCYFRFYRHFFTDLKRKGFDGHIVNLRNPKLHQIWKKKNQKNHFSLYSERKIFSQMSNLLRIFKTFHILKLSLFLIFKYITFFVKLDNYQLTFFIHLCCQLASYYNIFGKLAHYNALITANETSYTPIARNIANNLGIALVLIPNGGRINFGEVSYFITCNVFISWSEVYKSFTLGGIVADLYLNAGSLNMIKDNTRHLSNALMPRKFDFLLVEQNVFPDLGFCADHRYHLIMLKHFCRFAREYPQYSYGYLCRHSRKPKSHSDDFNRVISNNDLSLRQSNVEILHRNIPGQSTNAVHSSKVILALDSSIRIEALLCGKLCLSLNYCQANDDIFSFLFKYPMIIMDKDYSTFKNAMLSFFDEQQIRSMRTQISESKICDLLDKHFARKTAEYIADF